MINKMSGEDNEYKIMTIKLGRAFKMYREKARLSMREIYKQEKISIAVMSDMESGKKLPRIETLIRLMKKVNMPLEEAFSEKILKEAPCASKDNSFDLIKVTLEHKGFSDVDVNEIMDFLKFKDSKKFQNLKNNQIPDTTMFFS